MNRNTRWLIAALLFLATAISYLDRLCVPAAESRIRLDIPMTDSEYGRLGAYFLVAYGLMYIVGGRIMDWLGTRVGYTLMISFWSLASMATGLAQSITGLSACRFLLGVGEGGGFPGAGKAVAEWFPAQERSFAFGIFNTGSAIGSVIAVPLAVFVISIAGWRPLFYLTGSVGLMWAVLWWEIYRTPEHSALVSPEELEYIRQGRAARDGGADGPLLRWSELLFYPQVWGLMIAKFLTDAAYYFYHFWIPRYLHDIHGLELKSLAVYGWVPYLFMAGGSSIGGWIGLRLITGGMTLSRARMTTLAIAVLIMPASLLVTHVPLQVAVLLLGMTLFGHQFWSANVQTLVADIFPSRVVGSVEGLVGAAGAAGGAMFQLVSPWVISKFGYERVFVITPIAYLASLLLIWLFVGKIQPISASPREISGK